MKKTFSILLLLFYSTLSFSQIIIPKSKVKINKKEKIYFFGFNLKKSVNSQLVTYAIIKKNKNKKIEVNIISKDNFIQQISGNQQSKANPDGVNYLKNHDIELSTFNNIWKLRFDEYPLKGKKTKGWSSTPRQPSQQQMEILKKYSINNLSEFIIGENVFKILLDIQDPTWVDYYKGR